MEKLIRFDTWYRYDKQQFLIDFRRALDDIENYNGENLFDILEDYIAVL